MTTSTISELIVAGVIAIVGVAYLVNAGLNFRARLRADASAGDALKQAEAARADAGRQIAEAKRLADQLREHREWVEQNPEKFRAAVLAHLNGSAT